MSKKANYLITVIAIVLIILIAVYLINQTPLQPKSTTNNPKALALLSNLTNRRISSNSVMATYNGSIDYRALVGDERGTYTIFSSKYYNYFNSSIAQTNVSIGSDAGSWNYSVVSYYSNDSYRTCYNNTPNNKTNGKQCVAGNLSYGLNPLNPLPFIFNNYGVAGNYSQTSSGAYYESYGAGGNYTLSNLNEYTASYNGVNCIMLQGDIMLKSASNPTTDIGNMSSCINTQTQLPLYTKVYMLNPKNKARTEFDMHLVK